MTVLPQGSEISRRRLLQFGGLAGLLLGTGAVAGCAGPTGLPGPSTLTLALNRSLVSLDNKLNQFDAAVTVQRAVRQGLTAIGPETKPVLVLAESFVMTSPTVWTVRLREGIKYSDGTPAENRGRRNGPEDVPAGPGLLRGRLLPRIPHRCPRGRPDVPDGIQEAHPHPGLAHEHDPDQPRGQEQAPRAAGRRGHRPVRRDQVQPRRRHLQPQAERELLGPGPQGGQRRGQVPPGGIQPRHCAAQRRGGCHRLHHARLARTAGRTSRRRTQRSLQPPAEPDLLQLPQAGRAPAGRRPGPRGPQLGHRRRSPGQERAGELRQPGRGRHPVQPDRLRQDRRPTSTIRRRPRPGSRSSASPT